jgi:hypothetical protein
VATATRLRIQPTGPERAITATDLPRKSQRALDDLFRASPAGPMPVGVADGTPIVAPGTPVAAALVPLLRLAWRGKVFRAADNELRNRIGPLGIQAIRATVFRESSWLDGHEAIVLDYSRSSPPFRPIRDEIRLVAPGVYLGVVWWWRTKTINFALTFR